MTESTTPARKVCTKCGETKPLDEFHKRSDTSTGRVAHCKQCRKQAAAERWLSRGAEGRRDARERARLFQVEASPAQLDALRERNREQMRRWREANPEVARERSLTWQSENRERYLETRAARSDRYKEATAAYSKRYRRLNTGRIAEAKRRRRARKAGARVSLVDLDAIWTGSCALCADPLERTLRHPDPLSPSVDHIVPLIKGGTHEQANLQWTHLVCNLRKGTRLTD